MALGSIGGALGFGKSKGSSSQSGTSTTTGRENISTSISRLDDNTIAQLNELLGMFQGELGTESEYTRERALQDVRGLVDATFREYEEQYLPEVLSAQSQTGSFSSTAGQELANRGYSDAVQKGTQLQLSAIAEYAGLAQQERQTSLGGLEAVLAGLLGARETTQGVSEIDSTTKGSSQGSSKSSGWSSSLSGMIGI